MSQLAPTRHTRAPIVIVSLRFVGIDKHAHLHTHNSSNNTMGYMVGCYHEEAPSIYSRKHDKEKREIKEREEKTDTDKQAGRQADGHFQEHTHPCTRKCVDTI